MPYYFVLLMSLLVLPSLADAKSFESGPEQVALVEVYTSEGCSSCPPADKWLSKLKKDKQLFKRYVPLGMHVDYWNKLGWDDRMSAPVISQRQRSLARKWPEPSVYTPAVIYNGNEYKWRYGLKHGQQANVGTLKVSRVGARYKVEWRPTKAGKNQYEVTGTVFMEGVKTKVLRGENAGRTLEHDFAACGLRSVQLNAGQGSYTAIVDLPSCAAEKVSKRGITFFVRSKGDPRPIQAVGGYLSS